MMNNYHNVLNAVYNQPWAIQPEKLDDIDAILQLRIRGERSPVEEKYRAEHQAAAERRQTRSAAGGVAVIPIVGTIMHRAGAFEASGGISVQTLQRQISAVMDNSAVSSVVFDVDSPGGSVSGIPELAQVIRANRNPAKPMIGVANGVMASGALWLSAQFDELVASPSALIGSIGVLVKHIDRSKMNEVLGVKVTTVTNETSPNKGLGSPDEPLSDAALKEMQGITNSLAVMFEKDMAKGRGVSLAKVRSDFGGGSVFGADEAKSRGLVDRVGTLDETIARMSARGSRRRRASARQRQLDMI